MKQQKASTPHEPWTPQDWHRTESVWMILVLRTSIMVLILRALSSTFIHIQIYENPTLIVSYFCVWLYRDPGTSSHNRISDGTMRKILKMQLCIRVDYSLLTTPSITRLQITKTCPDSIIDNILWSYSRFRTTLDTIGQQSTPESRIQNYKSFERELDDWKDSKVSSLGLSPMLVFTAFCRALFFVTSNYRRPVLPYYE